MRSWIRLLIVVNVGRKSTQLVEAFRVGGCQVTDIPNIYLPGVETKFSRSYELASFRLARRFFGGVVFRFVIHRLAFQEEKSVSGLRRS